MAIQKERLLSTSYKITDTLGRPMYSDVKDGVVTTNRIAGREEYETNRQAFIEFGENALDVENLIAYMREGIVEDKLNPRQIEQFARGLYALPLYLALRKNNPIPENEMPPAVIDTAISANGIASVAEIIDRSDLPRDFQPSTVNGIYQFANGRNLAGHNFFIGMSKPPLSCPAPEQVVKRILNALMNRPKGDIKFAKVDWREYLSQEELRNIIIFGANYWELLLLTHKQKMNGFSDQEISRELEVLTVNINISLGY